mgnify:CR=1 FL=1
MAQSNVALSTTAATILAENKARKGYSVWNDSAAAGYLLNGPDSYSQTVSATVASAKVVADGYYEGPPGFTGPVTMVLASGTGSARITEW